MIAYFFTNMYQSGIHPGIQSLHAIDQMWLKYVDAMFAVGPEDPGSDLKCQLGNEALTAQFEMLRTFSRGHKTAIVLNGGDHERLIQATSLIEKLGLPFQTFDEPGLNNARTAVGVVLPERLYDDTARSIGSALNRGAMTSDLLSLMAERNYTLFELEFLQYKETCSLAR